MCLKINYDRARSKRIVAYKVVLWCPTQERWATPYQNAPVTIGEEMLSDRWSRFLTIKERRNLSIDKGIHTFVVLSAAQKFCNHFFIRSSVIECEVKPRQHVADGFFGDYLSAVYTKVKPIKIIK